MNTFSGPEPNAKQAASNQAASNLAVLMEHQLDVKLDPIALRLFIQAHWSRISTLAHIIHEDK